MFQNFLKYDSFNFSLYNLNDVKNTHGGVLLLVKMQPEASSFTKSIAPTWMFSYVFEIVQRFQIAQRIINTDVLSRKISSAKLQPSDQIFTLEGHEKYIFL